jgi:CheY-like chemotaxis protein/Tfp pilus assembly protein PilZ
LQDDVKKILIVDDDPIMRQVLRSDFTRRGFAVTEAGDGLQALEKLNEKVFDLIISDVRMPKFSGVELLNQVRKLYGELPIFMFVTGFSELSLEEAYAQGASALFPKPFNRQNFLRAIEWALLPKNEKSKESLPPLSTDFEIELYLKGSLEVVKGRMLNIGRGGMFVSMDSSMPATGDTLEFKISFQQDAPLQLTGQGIVRWMRSQMSVGRPSGCGIEFLEFDRNCMPEVAKIIEAFKPLPLNPET